MPARLLIDGDRRRIALSGALTVGRAPDNALRLAERDVSRHHARFTCAEGATWVEDLGSRNGTFVNGERIHGRRRLRAGDVVRLGEDVLRFDEGEETEELPSAPALATAARAAERRSALGRLLAALGSRSRSSSKP